MYIENIVERGEIAPQEQFLLFSTIFYNLILDFCVITRTRFFLRDKRLFEITEVEITIVDCMFFSHAPSLQFNQDIAFFLYSSKEGTQIPSLPDITRFDTNYFIF